MTIDQLASAGFPFYAVYLMKHAIDILPRGRALRVSVLVMDQTNMLSLAAAVDPMRAANRRNGDAVFNWEFVTPSGQASAVTAGFDIYGPAIDTTGTRPDLLLIVASFQLEAQSTPALKTTLRRLSRAGTVIAGIDGGSWLIADSGLLDGQQATTHWEDLDRFASRFPRVDTVRDRFHIAERVMTTGGASPCLDMMLHLIRSLHGADLASKVAGAFIYDPVFEGDAPQRLLPTQALGKRSPLMARAVELMEANIETPLPIDHCAKALGVSRRQLEQKFRDVLGQSPHAFALGLRLSEARRLATDTNRSVQDIALSTGFGSHAAFARAFRAAFDASVSQLRQSRGQRT